MTSDLFSVEGRLIIVTGGCGRLGNTFSKALKERGANVHVLDTASGCDVANLDSLERARDDILTKGIPYGIVNCAGKDPPPNRDPFGVSEETYIGSEWDEVFRVNTKGTYLVCRMFGALMEKEKRGSIVNIGSTYSLVSPRHDNYGKLHKSLAYCASKSAILNLTRYLGTYFKHVRVNTLCPGGVYNGQPDIFVERYEVNTPMERMAEPEDYIGPLIFLLSDASRYMTGANLVVDGGWTAW